MFSRNRYDFAFSCSNGDYVFFQTRAAIFTFNFDDNTAYDGSFFWIDRYDFRLDCIGWAAEDNCPVVKFHFDCVVSWRASFDNGIDECGVFSENESRHSILFIFKSHTFYIIIRICEADY